MNDTMTDEFERHDIVEIDYEDIRHVGVVTSHTEDCVEIELRRGSVDEEFETEEVYIRAQEAYVVAEYVEFIDRPNVENIHTMNTGVNNHIEALDIDVEYEDSDEELLAELKDETEDTMTDEATQEFETIVDGVDFNRYADCSTTIEMSIDSDGDYTDRGDKIKVEYLSATTGYENTTEVTGRIVSCYSREITLVRDSDRREMSIKIRGEEQKTEWHSLTVRTEGRVVGIIEQDSLDHHGITFLGDDYERVPVETDGGKEDQDNDDEDNDNEDTMQIIADTTDYDAFIQTAKRFEGDTVTIRYWSVQNTTVEREGELYVEDEGMYAKVHVYISPSKTRIVWAGGVENEKDRTVGQEARLLIDVPELPEQDNTLTCESCGAEYPNRPPVLEDGEELDLCHDCYIEGFPANDQDKSTEESETDDVRAVTNGGGSTPRPIAKPSEWTLFDSEELAEHMHTLELIEPSRVDKDRISFRWNGGHHINRSITHEMWKLGKFRLQESGSDLLVFVREYDEEKTLMTDGGVDQEVEDMDRELDYKLAALMAPPDARYVMMCRECRTCWTRKRDCKLTKAVRNGNSSCPDCDVEVDMVVDSKQD